jgi:hypothetical protein
VSRCYTFFSISDLRNQDTITFFRCSICGRGLQIPLAAQQRLLPLVKESENAFPAFGAMSRIQQRDEPEEKLNPSEFRETLKSTLEAQN